MYGLDNKSKQPKSFEYVLSNLKPHYVLLPNSITSSTIDELLGVALGFVGSKTDGQQRVLEFIIGAKT